MKEDSDGKGRRCLGSEEVPLATSFVVSVSLLRKNLFTEECYTHVRWPHTCPAPCYYPTSRLTTLHKVFDGPVVDTHSPQVANDNLNAAVFA